MSLLVSLVRAYDRDEKAPPFGFSSQKIGYCVVLNPDGSVAEVADLRDTNKQRSTLVLTVPTSPKRSGRTPRPNFLWDNANYALGAGTLANHVDVRFEAFRDKHLNYLSGETSKEIVAFCHFLRLWNPADMINYFSADNLPTQGIVFAHVDRYPDEFLHQSKAARTFWDHNRCRWIAIEGKSTTPAVCLVTGEKSSIARTHPPIKGVSGAGGKSEMALISFNDNAYESYGHEQGDNAPISEAAAFKYTTALNRFLADNRHHAQIGDDMTVFWADCDAAESAAEANAWTAFMLGSPAQTAATEHREQARILANVLRLRDGKSLTEIAPNLAEGVRVHLLGLSPNAARLSVRFYWEESFGTLAENYAGFLRDVAMEAASHRQFFSIRAALLRTAPAGRRNGKMRYDVDRISPVLAGELTRAVLTGTRLPASLLNLLLQRIRSDHVLDRIRISLIKGLIVRDLRLDQRLPRRPDGTPMEDYLMRSDPDDQNEVRRLGRLFALIERAQLAALGDGINATVADKFLGSACATPGRVFPALIRAAKDRHLKRLRNGHYEAHWIRDPAHARRLAEGLEREIGLLWSSLRDGAPMQFGAKDQGLFLVGYFQERYATRTVHNSEEEPEPAGHTNKERDR